MELDELLDERKRSRGVDDTDDIEAGTRMLQVSSRAREDVVSILTGCRTNVPIPP